MGFYIELYCDTPQCPYGSGEQGVPGNNRATIAKEAKAQGWSKTDGRWRCDGCTHAMLTGKRPKRCTTQIALAGGECGACGSYAGQPCRAT